MCIGERHEHRRARSQGPFAPTASADHEPFLAMNPKQPLVIDYEALSAQQYEEPAIAEASSLMGKSFSRPRN